MELKNKLAIVIVVFNISNLIKKQIDLIKKYCMDDFDVMVVDNSSDSRVAEEVKLIANDLNCNYLKTNSTGDFSQSHATACNFAYQEFKNYKYMLFLDHDNFPVENFSVVEVMKNKVIGGVGQCKEGVYYYWPGCVMINNELLVDDIVDFSTNSDLKLDTGGNLYTLINKYTQEKCVGFDQYEIYDTNDIDYAFYNNICSPAGASKFTFMHFINASNWNNKKNNQKRIDGLLDILKERTKAIND